MAGARVAQADRPQRAEPDCIRPAGRHDLDRHTALIDGQAGVGLVPGGALGSDKRLVEGFILGFIKRAVEVIGLAAPIAGSRKDLVIVKAFGCHNRGDGVVKAELLPPGQRRDRIGQRAVGQRAGGDKDRRGFID